MFHCPVVTTKSGLRRTSTVRDFQIPYYRPEIPTWYLRNLLTKAIDENYEIGDEFKDENEGFKDPGRRGHRRPDDPWPKCSRDLDKLTANGSRIDISNDFEIDLGRLSHCEISHRDIHNRREISHCD